MTKRTAAMPSRTASGARRSPKTGSARTARARPGGRRRPPPPVSSCGSGRGTRPRAPTERLPPLDPRDPPGPGQLQAVARPWVTVRRRMAGGAAGRSTDPSLERTAIRRRRPGEVAQEALLVAAGAPDGAVGRRPRRPSSTGAAKGARSSRRPAPVGGGGTVPPGDAVGRRADEQGDVRGGRPRRHGDPGPQLEARRRGWRRG